MNLIQSHQDKINWKFIVFSGLFVAVFLNLFQPFGINNNNYSLEGLLAISGYGLISSICILIVELMISGGRTMGLKKYGLVWLIMSILFISICSLLYYKVMFEMEFSFYENLLIWILNISLVGLFVLIFWKTIENKKFYNFLFDKEVYVTIPSNYKSDGTLRILAEQLYLVASAGNYIIVYYLENNRINKRMIRNSMKNVESLTSKFPTLIRCHHSFLINTVHVKAYTSKHRNYKVSLHHVQQEIPVSRRSWRKIEKRLNSARLTDLNHTVFK